MAGFIPIESVCHTEEAAAIAELQAFLKKEFSLSEIRCERDLLKDSYIDFIRAEGTDWDDKQYLYQEPETCFQQAREKVEKDASIKISEYEGALGKHYPFKISGSKKNILIKKDDVTPVGIGYMWLKLYMLSQSEGNYVQFENGKESEAISFSKAFEKVFEFIAAFAVAGRHASTALWITGQSRSVDSYLSVLKKICLHIEQGTVKSKEFLEPNQLSTNDGRIDAILVSEPGGRIQVDSELYLVQATTQKKDLKIKTVTSTNINFFNSFFIRQISFVKKGILVVPHAQNDHHAGECSTADCVYVPLDRIFYNLGLVNLTGNLIDIGTQFSKKYLDLQKDRISWPEL